MMIALHRGRTESGARRLGAAAVGVTLAAVVGLVGEGRLHGQPVVTADGPAPAADPTTGAEGSAAEERWLRCEDIGGLQARTSALLLSGQRGGEVEGALLWTIAGPSPDGVESQVPFLVEVDGDSLLAGHRGERIPIAVYAYVLTSDGDLVTHRSQGLVLETGEYADRLRESGLKFFGRLNLEPGEYNLRVMVRNHATNRYFLTWTGVRVPDSGEQPFGLLPPIFSDRSTRWVTAHQDDLDEGDVLGLFAGGGFIAAGKAVVAANEAAELVLAGLGIGGGEVRATARIENQQRRTVAEPAVEVSDQAARRAGAVELYSAGLEGVDLPDGEYRLILAVEDAEGRRVSRAVPFMVSARRDPVAWAALDTTAAPAPARTAVTPEEQLRKRKEIRREYLAGMTLLAEGDLAGARRAVADVERRVIAVGTGRAQMALRRLERAVALEFVERGPRSVMPIVNLHRQLYRTYTARHESILAAHSWMIAAELAELASRYQPRPIPEGFAEAVLVGLASDLVQSAASVSAHALLEKCLALSPDHEAALLALGAAYERAGDYDQAVITFRRLSGAHPGNSEGRLRLAVNLARNGQVREAMNIYRGLIDTGAAEWITAISFQELAGALIAKDRVADAVTLLREGMDRLPENQRLLIQLAFALDRLGRPWEATDMVKELDRRARGDVESPRVRYAEWPALARRASHEFVTEAAREALPSLVIAVKRAAGRGGKS